PRASACAGTEPDPVAAPPRSIGARQPQHVLGQIGEDEVRRDWRDLVEPRLAKLTLDIVFLSKAEAAMRLNAHVGRLPGGVGGEQLRHIGLLAAILPPLIELGRAL